MPVNRFYEPVFLEFSIVLFDDILINLVQNTEWFLFF